MAEIKWIKVVTDIFDDEKILLIESLPEADSIIVIWFKLLCLAGKQNNHGVFLMNDRIAYTDQMLSTIFRRKESTVQLALRTFEEFGMVEIINDVITIPNWDKHQNLDAYEKRKEADRLYQSQKRANQKAIAASSQIIDRPSTDASTDVGVLDKNRLDKNRLDESNKTAKRFLPPTLDEISAYCSERGNEVDAQRFIDYYSANGWMVGKNKMKDWKAAVRTWENNGYSSSPKKKTLPGGSYQNADTNYESDVERIKKLRELL